jgi:hypothetical protein
MCERTKLGVPLEAPRLFEKEKFKCDCIETGIADTLLTRVTTEFRKSL